MSQWCCVVVSVLAVLISSTHGVQWEDHPDGKAEAQHGYDLSVSCSFTGGFDGFYKKSEDGTEIKLVASDRVLIKKTFDTLYELEIKGTEETDYGTYICKNDAGETAALEISIGAAIKKPSSPQILPFSPSGTVEAVVYGMPRPSITWTLNGKVIIIRKTDGKLQGDNLAKYSVGEMGALTISNVDAADSGTYQVYFKKGATKVAEDISVETGAVPKISKSPDAAYTPLDGSSLTLPCEWSDAPTDLKWTFTDALGTTTEVTDGVDKDKGLTIATVSKASVGTYTCEGSSKFGSDKASGKITVVVFPPSIISTFDATYVRMVGEGFQQKCEATGEPSLKMMWKKFQDDGSMVDVAPTSEETGNIGLEIAALKLTDSGKYGCFAEVDATNPDGTIRSVNKVFVINVVSKPAIMSSTTNMDSALGRKEVIRCSAQGTPLPDITFHRGDTKLPIPASKDNSGVRGVSLELEMTKEHFGEITCKATNDYGEDTQSFTITEIEKASVPVLKDIADYGVDYIKVEWEKSVGVVDTYLVEMNNDDLPKPDVTETIELDKVYKNLNKNTNYSFRVAAKNLAGTTDYSPYKKVTTKDIIAPGKPYMAHPKVKGTSVMITWKAPLNAANERIMYKVERCLFVNSTEGSCEQLDETTDKSVTLNDLKAETSYRVKITAINQKVVGDTAILEFVTGKNITIKIHITVSTMKEDEGKGLVTQPSTKGLSGGAVAGIVIAIILIVLIVIDLFCCFFNNFGFTHCCFETFCSSKTKGKYAPADSKDAEAQELKAHAETETV